MPFTPEQRNAYNRKRYQDPKHREYMRAIRLKNKYGITPQDYDEMFKSQGGVCWICKEPPGEDQRQGPLCVDHNHKTGKVRGLLCRRCNRHLGGFEDSAELMRSAVAYLEEFDGGDS